MLGFRQRARYLNKVFLILAKVLYYNTFAIFLNRCADLRGTQHLAPPLQKGGRDGLFFMLGFALAAPNLLMVFLILAKVLY